MIDGPCVISVESIEVFAHHGVLFLDNSLFNNGSGGAFSGRMMNNFRLFLFNGYNSWLARGFERSG